MTEIHTVADEHWNDRLAAFAQRSPFHRREWLQVLAGHYGVTPRLLATGPASAPASLWPFLEQRKGPLRVLGSPLPGWCTAYLGPLFAPGCDPAAATAAIVRSPAFRRASYVELRVVDPAAAIDLQPFGFTRESVFATPLLDLAPGEDALWAGLDGKCRNVVRKAQKLGYAVAEERDPSFAADFLRMSAQVFARWQLHPPYDQGLVERAWRELAPAGLLRVYSACRDGRRASTVVVVQDDATACYIWGATDDACRSDGTSSLVLWEAIRQARASGRRTFDFVSASGTAGAFKLQFGPTVVPFAHHWGRARTRFEGWLKDRYAAFLRRRRRR